MWWIDRHSALLFRKHKSIYGTYKTSLSSMTRHYKYTQQHMRTSIKRCVKDYVHLQLLY